MWEEIIMPNTHFAAVDISKIPQRIGTIWFVSILGDDSNSGKTPRKPFLTLGKAISESFTGDSIEVGAGTYTEIGITINKQLTIIFGGGVVLNPVSGTALTISSNMCSLRGSVKIASAIGAVGLSVSGDENYLENVIIIGGATAFLITGNNNLFIRMTGINYTATGINIQGSGNLFFQSNMFGDGGATRGFYISQSGAISNTLFSCASIGNGNGTAGFECAAGTVRNFIGDCNSGGGDGERVDDGINNMWANFADTMKIEWHECTYPFFDGEGGGNASVSIVTDAQDETNSAATTKNYWGEPKIAIPVGILTNKWDFIGINIAANTTRKIIRSGCYRIVSATQAVRSGGNAWNEGATVLTFDDANDFAVDNLIWITSSAYKADGEIVKITNITDQIVTIAREGSQFGAANTGLRWNHSANIGAGTLYAYLCHQDSAKFQKSCFDFSAGSAKDFDRFEWHTSREMNRNDGIIIRSINSTDSTNGTTYDLTIIYRD